MIYESKDDTKEIEVTSDQLITADSELAIFLSMSPRMASQRSK
jgi:hypothetical protein